MKKVLVVNQDPALGLLLSRVLRGRFKTSIVSDPYVMFDHLRDNHYDSIIIDSNLTDMSSEDIVKNLKLSGLFYLIPVLILHEEGEELGGEIFRFDGIDFISKPFDPLELEKKVSSLSSLEIVD